MLSFLFHEVQVITDLLLICDSYMSWITWFLSLKPCVEFFHFQLRFVFIKAHIFYSVKCMDSLTLKRYKSFQGWNSRKTTHGFVSRFLSCNKKFWNLLMSVWVGDPQNWPCDIFFKPRKPKFSMLRTSQ